MRAPPPNRAEGCGSCRYSRVPCVFDRSSRPNSHFYRPVQRPKIAAGSSYRGKRGARLGRLIVGARTRRSTSGFPLLLQWNIWSAGNQSTQTTTSKISRLTEVYQKGVQITHRNVIANILQCSALDSGRRKLKEKDGPSTTYTEYSLGVLPMSHAYTLSVMQLATYRGDGILVLPTPDLIASFKAISKYRISTLWLVSATLSNRPRPALTPS
jgi:hypothetical protein